MNRVSVIYKRGRKIGASNQGFRTLDTQDGADRFTLSTLFEGCVFVSPTISRYGIEYPIASFLLLRTSHP